eukprot:scaffold17927_cov70-Skeletonema_menzelii.AAC.2
MMLDYRQQNLNFEASSTDRMGVATRLPPKYDGVGHLNGFRASPPSAPRIRPLDTRRHHVVIASNKTEFTPAGKKKPKGEGQGRDDTDQDVSTEPEIRRQSNLDSTTSFVPPNRPPA